MVTVAHRPHVTPFFPPLFAPHTKARVFSFQRSAIGWRKVEARLINERAASCDRPCGVPAGGKVAASGVSPGAVPEYHAGWRFDSDSPQPQPQASGLCPDRPSLLIKAES